MFKRDRGSPSYENISLSNWLHSISIIMMDIFFPRGFSITFTSTFSSLQSPLDDWDMISNLLVFGCCGVCSDSTLELLLMAQSGTILQRSCSWLMLMASAMEIRFDLRIMEARALLPTLIARLEASRKITTSLSESSKDSWLRWLLLWESVFLDRVTDRPISNSISWKLASRPRICWVPQMTSLRKDSTFLCSCYGESCATPPYNAAEQRRWKRGTLLVNYTPYIIETCRRGLMGRTGSAGWGGSWGEQPKEGEQSQRILKYSSMGFQQFSPCHQSEAKGFQWLKELWRLDNMAVLSSDLFGGVRLILIQKWNC